MTGMAALYFLTSIVGPVCSSDHSAASEEAYRALTAKVRDLEETLRVVREENVKLRTSMLLANGSDWTMRRLSEAATNIIHAPPTAPPVPRLPPIAPPVPYLPPKPPVPPAVPGARLVSSVPLLREALDECSPGTSVTLQLPPQSFRLSGIALTIPVGCNATLLGESTMFDAEGISRHLDVHGSLVMSDVHMKRGFSNASSTGLPGQGGSVFIVSSGTAVLGSCSISHSTASKEDGALCVSGTLEMMSCSIRNSSVLAAAACATRKTGAMGVTATGVAVLISCTMCDTQAEQAGAISIAGTFHMSHCRVSNSTSLCSHFGVARILPGSNSVIISCMFDQTESFAYAGVLGMWGGSAILRECQVSKSTAGGMGGTIAIVGGSLELQNCTIHASHANNDGGMLRISGTAVVACKDCVLSQCTAVQAGGAIIQGAGNLHLVNVTCVDGSVTNANGGVVAMSAGTLSAIQCTFSRCNAPDAGGAFYLEGGQLALTRSIISDCESREGGGIRLSGTTTVVKLNVSSVVRCRASYHGAGVSCANGGTLSAIDSQFMACGGEVPNTANGGSAIFIDGVSSAIVDRSVIANCSGGVSFRRSTFEPPA